MVDVVLGLLSVVMVCWGVVGVAGGCLVWGGGVASGGKVLVLVISGFRWGLFARPATIHVFWRSGVAGFGGRNRGGVVEWEWGVCWGGDCGDGWVAGGATVGTVGE